MEGIHEALKKHHAESCASAAERKAFLERTACYSNPSVVTEVRAEHQRYVGLVEAVPVLAKAERKQSICCAGLYIRDAVRETDVKYCKPEVVAYLDKLIQSIVSNLSTLSLFKTNLCSSFRTPAPSTRSAVP